jgi:chromosome segregation ATPase
MSIRESIIKLFGPKDAAARLADLETKHRAASENVSIARAAFSEASLAVEAGVQGADRQLAKTRDALATAEARLADLEAARSIARRAVEEAAGLAEAESVAKRWAAVETKSETIRTLGEEIDNLVSEIAARQERMSALAAEMIAEIPFAPDTRDAIAPERLEGFLRLALFKSGFAWALKTGLSQYEAPAYLPELEGAIAAFTKYAPRNSAKAA